MTWEIVVGIITIVGAAIVLGKLIYGLSKTLTELECDIKTMSITVQKLTKENKEQHTMLQDCIRQMENETDELKLRIAVLENLNSADKHDSTNNEK